MKKTLGLFGRAARVGMIGHMSKRHVRGLLREVTALDAALARLEGGLVELAIEHHDTARLIAAARTPATACVQPLAAIPRETRTHDRRPFHVAHTA